MSLLRKALEGELETPPTTVAEPATPVENEGNQPNNETGAVVMTGPLGQVYTQALAVAFAKKDPVTDEAVTKVAAMESQANDAIVQSGIINAISSTDATADLDNPEAMIYGVSSQQIEQSDIVEVATQMSQYELEQPEEFIVVIDGTDMSADPIADLEKAENANEYLAQPVNEANLEKNELVPVLEAMVVSMGGRVVYSLRQALEAIGEMREERAEGEVEAPVVDESVVETAVEAPAVEVPPTIETPVVEEPVVVTPEATDPAVAPVVETAAETIPAAEPAAVEEPAVIAEPVVEPLPSPEAEGETTDAVAALESEAGKGKDGKKPAAKKENGPAIAKANKAKGVIAQAMGINKDSKVKGLLLSALSQINSLIGDLDKKTK